MSDGAKVNLTPMQAWRIISKALSELYNYRAINNKYPYTNKEFNAEVMCYRAFKEMEEKNGNII